ncbi:hypothetical protein SLEP1_g43913 [Rubroshorea leprosula]|uniref:Uncharacterized protein n=1 Tax=Rubroshorea leprosula TaxID=152421 RepID=A0AAV5LEI9_9ROSI|nr:hypothetical protein SLEP1_g43913 [Rubroshorea leprosula]
MNNQKSNGEEKKLSGRAALVPRPYAVLSGPESPKVMMAGTRAPESCAYPLLRRANAKTKSLALVWYLSSLLDSGILSC